MRLILILLIALHSSYSAADTAAGQLKPPAFTLHGYVLQVGAYRDEAAAKAAVSELGGPRMFIVPIRLNEQDWYVVLYDNFTNRATAEEAARQFAQEFPRASAWVRDASQLRKLVRYRPSEPAM